ncbi:protein PTST homolog 3, chloroplastic-like [Quercus robur]|uniref:protein PTST homolog 3, chloroplastic-like n=1 Tax=Quercus robur TaxID=38942 RepID=UPI002162153B|nr:protein PTST homolog 3, chloroplastic-like [Quercus robur]
MQAEEEKLVRRTDWEASMARKIMSGIGVKSRVSFALFVWKLGPPTVTIISGQDKKANTLVVEHISSTDISTVGIDYSSPSSDLDFNSGDFRSLPVESSSNLFLEEKVSHRLKGHDEKVKDVAENAFLSTEVSTMEGSSINFDLNTDENSYMPVELSVLEEKTSSNLQVEDEKVNKMVEDVAFSNEGKKHYSWSSNPDFNPTDFKSMPIESPISLSLEERPSYNLKDQDEKIKNNDVPLYSSEDSRMPTEFSANSSLEEKVTKFIQNGDLDMIEDNAYGILNERVAEESKEFIKLQNSVVQPAEEHSGNSLNGGSVAVTLNGSTLTSKDVTPAALVTQPLRRLCSLLWNISRFPYTFSDDVEKAMAKDLHPKLLAGMFFFFALGATGGITALLTSDKPIFESPHAVTGLTGLALLTLQATLPALFEVIMIFEDLNSIVFFFLYLFPVLSISFSFFFFFFFFFFFTLILGSGIMTLFLVHAALGFQLGLSF